MFIANSIGLTFGNRVHTQRMASKKTDSVNNVVKNVRDLQERGY